MSWGEVRGEGDGFDYEEFLRDFLESMDWPTQAADKDVADQELPAGLPIASSEEE
ncbi:hypothetical protein [Curtobacterium sp. Leaf261]|uniref:hypothetical protein n=1 Tax=Curtobacterium sp. Leaf261 TaxID=1736311 RepID=UPI000AD544CC|nr:hypothetical protein [Curtobacterium sp. Leaf261]